jgi:hypothetical protein
MPTESASGLRTTRVSAALDRHGCAHAATMAVVAPRRRRFRIDTAKDSIAINCAA